MKGVNAVAIIFGTIMVVVVSAGAIAFAFTDFMDEKIYGTKRTIFVFLLAAYAVYRGYRLFAALRSGQRRRE